MHARCTHNNAARVSQMDGKKRGYHVNKTTFVVTHIEFCEDDDMLYAFDFDGDFRDYPNSVAIVHHYAIFTTLEYAEAFIVRHVVESAQKPEVQANMIVIGDGSADGEKGVRPNPKPSHTYLRADGP